MPSSIRELVDELEERNSEWVEYKRISDCVGGANAPEVGKSARWTVWIETNVTFHVLILTSTNNRSRYPFSREDLLLVASGEVTVPNVSHERESSRRFFRAKPVDHIWMSLTKPAISMISQIQVWIGRIANCYMSYAITYIRPVLLSVGLRHRKESLMIETMSPTQLRDVGSLVSQVSPLACWVRFLCHGGTLWAEQSERFCLQQLLFWLK